MTWTPGSALGIGFGWYIHLQVVATLQLNVLWLAGFSFLRLKKGASRRSILVGPSGHSSQSWDGMDITEDPPPLFPELECSLFISNTTGERPGGGGVQDPRVHASEITCGGGGGTPRVEMRCPSQQ